MLKKWHTLTPVAYFTQELEDEQDEIPFWNDVDLRSAQVGQHLCDAQIQCSELCYVIISSSVM